MSIYHHDEDQRCPLQDLTRAKDKNEDDDDVSNWDHQNYGGFSVTK